MGNSKLKVKNNNATKGSHQNRRKPFNNGKQQYKPNKSNLPKSNQWRRKKPQDEVNICTVMIMTIYY